MTPAMSDATPLSPHFLASLSQFLEQQHGGPGQGDISEAVKVAIAKQMKTHPPEGQDLPSVQQTTTKGQSADPSRQSSDQH